MTIFCGKGLAVTDIGRPGEGIPLPLAADAVHPQRWWPWVALIIAAHVAIVAWVGYCQSPVYDEPAHIAAGLSHWRFGRFDLYRVNPPLVRMVACLPFLVTDDELTAPTVSNLPFERPEFELGQRLIKRSPANFMRWLTWSRWCCLPFTILGAVVSFRWCRELYGDYAGFAGLLLWCLSPSVIAYAAIISPDGAAGATGLAAGYTFWKWLRLGGWSNAAWAALALGAALLTKTTWAVLTPLWLVLGLTAASARGSTPQKQGPHLQLAAILLGGWYLLNLGYGFDKSFRPLGEIRCISQRLKPPEDNERLANRFSGTLVGRLPVPFPEDYIRGIDVQKSEFEHGKVSYLLGQSQPRGWWYYYLVALLVKEPAAYWSLAVLALWPHRGRAAHWLDVAVILAPAIVVIALVSSQTGFSRYYRYVWPAVPYLYVGLARSGHWLSRQTPWRGVATSVCFVWAIGSSLHVHPHYMSYFNELAGGPQNGHAWLLDANIDWGQDLLFLKQWYDRHPAARPLHVAAFGPVSPNDIGIDCSPVPQSPPPNRPGSTPYPPPGWYAVSVNRLHGYQHFPGDSTAATVFLSCKPVDRVGYSMLIFHVAAPDGTSRAGTSTSDTHN